METRPDEKAKGQKAKRRKTAVSEPTRGRGSGVQIVYETLKRDILDMTLAPGHPLDETRLSERFSMSRTPVREALVRLAAEGLITTLPNRNSIVAVIDFATVAEYFDALTLMYRVSTRLAAMRHTNADLVDIRRHQDAFARAVSNADAIAMITVNRDFHLAIATAGGNRYFTDFFSRLLDEGQRLLRLYYSSYNDHLPKRYVDEHDAMIAAIADRDVERADRLASEHAGQVVSQLQSFLASRIGREMALDPTAAGAGKTLKQ